MQVMSPHLATFRRAAVWNRGPHAGVRTGDQAGAHEPKPGTAASFRRACLVIAAWLLALLLVPIVFFQPF